MPKRRLKLLAIVMTLAMVLSAPGFAFAAIDSYLATGEDGAVYSYGFNDLLDAFNSNGALWTDFMSKTPFAIHDDSDKYVDYQALLDAYTNGTDIDDYIAGSDAQAPDMPGTINTVTVGEDGQLVVTPTPVGEVTVASVNAVNGKVTVTFSEAVTEVPAGLSVLKDGEAMDLAAEAFAVVGGKVEVTVPEIAKGLEEQTVVYSVKLGDAAAVAADAVIIPVSDAPAAPAVTADDDANVITGIDATMEYKIGDGEWTKYDAAAAPDLSGDMTVLVRVAATDTVPASDNVTLTFTSNDVTAPEFAATAVTAGATNYEFTLNFNEEVALADDATVTVTQSGATFSGTPTVNEDATKVNVVVDTTTAAPTNNIAAQVEVAGVTDLAGNALVNGATTYTPNDTTVPSLLSVQVVNSTTLELTFNERVTIPNAAASDISLTYAADSTYNVGDLTGSTITYDGNKATIKLQQELLNGDYYFVAKASKIVDKANNNIGFTSKSFATSGLADSKPALASAVYNSYTGKLTINFTEAVNNSDAAIDETKIVVKGANGLTYTLQDADYADVVATDSTIVTADLKTKLTTLTTPFTVTLGANAVVDATGNNNDADATGIVATHLTAPALTNTVLDEKSQELTLTFDKAVKKITALSNGAVLKLTAGGTETTYTSVAGADFTITGKATNVDGATQVFTIGGVMAFIANTDITAAKISLPADFVEAATSSVAQPLKNNIITDAALTYDDDATTPKVVSASYNSLTKQLSVVFDENVSNFDALNGANFNNIQYSTSADGSAPAALDGNGATSGTAPTYIRALTSPTAGFDSPANPDSIYLVFGAGIVDGSGNAIAVADRIVKVAMTDLIPPTASVIDGSGNAGIQTTDKNHITLQFNEKVDATTAETAANYNIYATANPAQKLTVTSAKLMSDQKTVVLITADQLAIDYTLEITGIKDQAPAGNVIIAGIANKSKFDGILGVAAAPAAVNTASAAYTDEDNSGNVNAGDKITLTFNTEISAGNYTVADVQLYKNDGAALDVPVDETFGVGATVAKKALDATDANWAKKLVITLGTNPVFTVTGDPAQNNIDVSANTAVKDLTGVAATAVTAPHRDIANASAAAASKIASATFTDVNGDGKAGANDTIVIAYDKPVAASYNAADSTATAQQKALAQAFAYDKNNDNTVEAAMPANSTAVLAGDNKTITITLAGALAVNGGNEAGIDWATGTVSEVAYRVDGDGVAGAGQAVMKNAWGTQNDSTEKALSKPEAETAGPQIESITYFNTNPSAVSGDNIVIDFTENISTGTVNRDDFVATNLNFDTTGNNQLTETVDGDKLTITLGNNATITAGAKLNIAASITSIADVYGNAATASATAFDVAVSGDTTRPYLVSAELTDVDNDGTVSDDDVIKFTFSEAITPQAADADTIFSTVNKLSNLILAADMKSFTATLDSAAGIDFATSWNPVNDQLIDLAGNQDNTVFTVAIGNNISGLTIDGNYAIVDNQGALVYAIKKGAITTIGVSVAFILDELDLGDLSLDASGTGLIAKLTAAGVTAVTLDGDVYDLPADAAALKDALIAKMNNSITTSVTCTLTLGGTDYTKTFKVAL